MTIPAGITSKTALLVMDFQGDVVDRLGSPRVVGAASQAIEAARTHDVLVIFVRVAFRPGYPEVSPANRTFAAIAAGQVDFTEASPATQPHPDLAPVGGEPLVIKRRVSAFSGSDLHVILRANAIGTLVLTGLATSGVVLSTLREAADRDFQLVVLSDACDDADPEVHRVLMEKVFPRQADVRTVQEWAATLEDAH